MSKKRQPKKAERTQSVTTKSYQDASEYIKLLDRAEEILSASITFLLSPNQRPYLAPAVWSLRWVPRLGLGTFGVDSSWRVYYDPEAVVVWNNVIGIAAVIEHEVWHLLRKHAERANGVGAKDMVSARLWNWAADAEIHSDEIMVKNMESTLVDVKTGKPCQPITPALLGSEPGHIAEYYYQHILNKMNPKTEFSNEGLVIDVRDPSSGDEYEISIPRDDPAEHDVPTKQKPSPGEGNDGSGATGQKAPWEEDDDGGIGDSGERLVRNKVAKEIVNQSRMAGRGAGQSILDWAEEHLAGPKISWQEELRNLISNAIAWVTGSLEYTRTRFSRKQMPGMPLMPGMIQPVPEIAIVIDTSGSMSDDMLIGALSEIKAIITSFGTYTGVSVYAVDDAVGWTGRVFDVRSIKLVGRGGTDMGKGIRAALAHEPRPNIIVILTDGETGWPESRPFDVQIVIGIVGDENRVLSKRSLPTWASKVVWIDS